jgi:hypothetical protein
VPPTRLVSAQEPIGPERLPWGCASLFAARAGSVVEAGFQARPRPSSAFLTPSTVSTATSLAGLFHPAATSRVPPFRGFPFQHSRARSSRTAALSPLTVLACQRLPASASSHGPNLRALLRAGSPLRRAGVTRRAARFPSWVSPPPGCSLFPPSRAPRLSGGCLRSYRPGASPSFRSWPSQRVRRSRSLR